MAGNSIGQLETVARQAIIAAAAFPQVRIAAAAFPQVRLGRRLFARVRGVVVVPGHYARKRRCGGGQLAVAHLRGQLGDWRDLRYLKRRSALDLGLGRILVAEVRE
jgi:hypothetical protein